MAAERSKPGRFPEERQEPEDRTAESEGGGPDEPRVRDPHAVDAREEAKKRSSRYVMEDREEAEERRREARGEERKRPARGSHGESREGAEEGRGRASGAGDKSFEKSEEEAEEGFGNESRPHRDEPIPEEKRTPDDKDEPGVDQEEGDAWDRIDRDSL